MCCRRIRIILLMLVVTGSVVQTAVSAPPAPRDAIKPQWFAGDIASLSDWTIIGNAST